MMREKNSMKKEANRIGRKVQVAAARATGGEADGVALKRKGREKERDENRNRKKRNRRGRRMREVERRSNFLTRRLVAA